MDNTDGHNIEDRISSRTSYIGFPVRRERAANSRIIVPAHAVHVSLIRRLWYDYENRNRFKKRGSEPIQSYHILVHNTLSYHILLCWVKRQLQMS